MLYKVLTPPPGFHSWRRLQLQLASQGRPLALALFPLCVLGGPEAPVQVPAGPLYWIKSANGWSLGKNHEEGRSAFGTLIPSPTWLIIPWDWGPQPTVGTPVEIPQKKYRLGLLELEAWPGGIRWHWLEEGPYLLPEGL